MALVIIISALVFILFLKLKLEILITNGRTDARLRLSLIKLPIERRASDKPLFRASEKRRIIKAFFEVADELRKRVIIEKIKIDSVQADPDPYAAVMSYNILNAVLGSALLYVERSFNLKEKSVKLGVSFNKEESETEIRVGLSIRVIWFLHPGSHVGREVLSILADRRRKKA